MGIYLHRKVLVGALVYKTNPKRKECSLVSHQARSCPTTPKSQLVQNSLRRGASALGDRNGGRLGSTAAPEGECDSAQPTMSHVPDQMAEERDEAWEPAAGVALSGQGQLPFGRRLAGASFTGRRGTCYKETPHKEVSGVCQARTTPQRGWGVRQKICGGHREGPVPTAWAPEPLTPALFFPLPLLLRG